jgi:hypothetical protein
MAPRRGRSTRKASITPREPSAQASDSSALSELPPATAADEKDRCPSCPDEPYQVRAGEKDTWIQCNKCKVWFHWRCVGEGADHEALQRWWVAVYSPVLYPLRSETLLMVGTASPAEPPTRRSSLLSNPRHASPRASAPSLITPTSTLGLMPRLLMAASGCVSSRPRISRRTPSSVSRAQRSTPNGWNRIQTRSGSRSS